MIINALLDMLYGLLDWITSGLNIPDMPDEVSTILQSVVQYIQMGIRFIGNFTHLDYLLILFGIVLAVDAGILVYKLIMWILRKIPMFGMS